MRAQHWPWFAAWLAVVAAIVVSLWLVRRRVVDDLSRPEKIAQWQAWRAETERQDPASGPVRRKAARGDEPPALVLLRDHFGAIVATSVLMGSFLFGFLAFIIHGIARSRATGRPSPRSELSDGQRS
ncbi:MAG TPA: hypothetical protein VFW87_13680 [Pirellulales bacterium]|nr:hypothetical protein [Pirellulales bacterium]